MLKLIRRAHTSESTYGSLYLNGVYLCKTLEDAPRPEKIYGRTRIPAGKYALALRKEGGFHARYSERWPDMHNGMVHLLDVPNYEWILLHVGNTHRDTHGCILVGSSVATDADGHYWVTSSRVTYKRVYPQIADYIAGGDAWIEIVDEE